MTEGDDDATVLVFSQSVLDSQLLEGGMMRSKEKLGKQQEFKISARVADKPNEIPSKNVHSHVNTLLAVWRSLWRSRSSLWVTLAVDAGCFHGHLIIRAIRRKWRWSGWRYCRNGRVFLLLRSIDVNHFAIAMIASDRIMAFVCVWAGTGAQRRSRNVPWSRVMIHLKWFAAYRLSISGLKCDGAAKGDEIPQKGVLKKINTGDHQGEQVSTKSCLSRYAVSY